MSDFKVIQDLISDRKREIGENKKSVSGPGDKVAEGSLSGCIQKDIFASLVNLHFSLQQSEIALTSHFVCKKYNLKSLTL